MTKRENNRMARKMRRYLAAKDEGKKGYAEADRLLDELAKEIGLNKAVKLDDSGRTGMLIDQFAERNVVFKPAGVRRFDLKIQEGRS